jgi:hypothetical protein
MWAYVNNGAVKQIFTAPQDWSDANGVGHSAQLFAVGTPTQLLAVGVYPAVYADSAPTRFATPSNPVGALSGGTVNITRTWTEPSLAAAQAAASQIVDNARIAACQGGTTISGIAVQTDPYSLILLLGAFLSASQNSAFTASWPANSGVSVTLNATQIIALFQGVVAFINGQIAIEQTRQAAIAAATTVPAIESLLQGYGL